MPAPPDSRADSVTPDDFRDAMSRLAAGVSIVTSTGPDGEPRGLTATAVCSVSLAPPLVLASLSNESTTGNAVAATEAFVLNFLGRGEEELARRFADATAEKFAGFEWKPGATGCPTIPEALAICECLLEKAVPAGDHTLYVGRVVRVSVNQAVPNDPLIYFSGAYGALSGGGST